MISEDYSFAHFVNSVNGKDRLDIICLAEREATEAWRRSRLTDGQASEDIQANQEYQSKLLGLIDYVRHGLHSREFTPQDRQMLRKIPLQRPHFQRPHFP